jgi:hypothetical protein
MKEDLVDGKRSVITHHQSAEDAGLNEGAFHDPLPLIASQCPTVLSRRIASILPMRSDQLGAALGQLLTQGAAIVVPVGNPAARLLAGTAPAMSTPYADRRLEELDLRRESRLKEVSQRNTLAVDHQHPLCPVASLGFAGSTAPLFPGAKPPSRNDSLHFDCWCSFRSPRKARQIRSQIPGFTLSRNLRQQVEGAGNSSDKSHQRAPLLRFHKMPSSTLRSGSGGRPPRGRWGSRRQIYSRWASVSNRPYGAVCPLPGAIHFHNSPPQENGYREFSQLQMVLRWLLAIALGRWTAWMSICFLGALDNVPLIADGIRQRMSGVGLQADKLDYRKSGRKGRGSMEWFKGKTNSAGVRMLVKLLGVPRAAFAEDLIAVARK